MESVTITESELLDAITAASPGEGPDHARTLAEIARESGIGERQVRKAMHCLHRAGRLVVHKVHRAGIDGRRTTVPAYTIRPAVKAKLRRA